MRVRKEDIYNDSFVLNNSVRVGKVYTFPALNYSAEVSEGSNYDTAMSWMEAVRREFERQESERIAEERRAAPPPVDTTRESSPTGERGRSSARPEDSKPEAEEELQEIDFRQGLVTQVARLEERKNRQHKVVSCLEQELEMARAQLKSYDFDLEVAEAALGRVDELCRSKDSGEVGGDILGKVQGGGKKVHGNLGKENSTKK